MTRGKKIALWILGGIGGLVVLALIAGILVVRTDWFRDTVRRKIIAAVEESTGGRVEIGSFNFDWTQLRAEIRNFALHGLEPSNAAPLFRANLLRVDLKLLSPFKGFVDIAYLLVDTPQANLMVNADGSTNVPAPKVKKPASNKSGLETVVDLAIGRFELRNGTAAVAERKDAINAVAENLRARLAYNPLNPRYTGTLAMSPLFVNQLRVDVNLPVTLEKDRVAFDNAVLTTPQSRIAITGALSHLANPRTNAHINARLALDEVKQAAALDIPLDTRRGPAVLNADITAATNENGSVQIQSANINLGQTNLQASGAAQQVQFEGDLALGELGRLFRVEQQPEGAVHLAGNAAYNSAADYRVNANVDARNVALRQGTTRISGISLDTAVAMDPHRIDIGGLRLSALGGTFAGSASLEEMDRFRVAGNLARFDIETALRAFSGKPLGYDGIVSGPVQAEGSIKNTNALAARANLAIAPGPHGVPVTGSLNANYDARGDTIVLAPSFLALPHTRVDLSGALGRQIQIRAVSRDLRDLRPVAPSLPIAINNGGSATITANVAGSLSTPRIVGDVMVTNFSAEGRPFSRLSAGLEASKSGAAVNDGLLAQGPLQARFAGSVGLRNWKPLDSSPVRADVTVRNADMQDVLALAGQASSVPVTGQLTVDAHVAGTVGDPQGNADVNVANGTIQGERFDSLVVRANMTPGTVQVPTLQLTAGPSRIDANAVYTHPPDDWKSGNWRAHVASNQVQLAQFQTLVKDRPGLRGILSLNADAAGHGTDFPDAIQSLNANINARDLALKGKSMGDLTATAQTGGQALRYNVVSNLGGSSIRIDGQSLLTGAHDTRATAAISNLPAETILALAGQSEIPVSGMIAANAEVAGTMDNPSVDGAVSVTDGKAYDQPFTLIQAKGAYNKQLTRVDALRIDAAGASITGNGLLANDRAQFQVQSTPIQLAGLRILQNARPGLAGVVQISASGAATMPKSGPPLLSTLTANLGAHQLSLNKRPIGDATLTANTQGREVAFALTSNVAQADIRGDGRLTLAPDYPVDARVAFNNVTYSGLSVLMEGGREPLEASLNGDLTVTGPVTRIDALRGTLQLTKLEAHAVPTGPGARPRVNTELHNEGPIAVALDRGLVTIRSAHIVGPHTNINLTGAAGISGAQALNLRADANVNLEAAEAFSTSLFSAGRIVLNAAVTGNAAKPVVNGRLELQNASFNTADAPVGLSNANGTIAFNGTEALIQNLTGEVGGGKVNVTGYASYGGPELSFRVQANADGIRVSAPSNITTQANVRITAAGTTTRSLVSGTVRIQDIAMHSHSDIGSMLSSAAAPPASPSVSTGLLAGMRFDIRIQTAPNVQFRTTLAQNLEADADLSLRGTLDHPGMIGRIAVTQGEVVFFGSKYTIDQGTISFFNPNKIEPVLNVDLSTSVQGVDVALSVSGPIERMKFSYRSDPPLQFSDIVSLLASGKPPTSDPVLAAHEPVAPQQSFQQAGASTLLGQAVANPVSGRLQRLFGVTKLKIDPQITGSSNTPMATLTLQQQITRDLTFTYIQDVTQSNPQTIRVEWAINPQWSAIAGRNDNGQLDVDVFYKKRFW